MSTISIEVHHEVDDLIPCLEHWIERSLGYKQDIYNILCYPVNQSELKCQKFVERALHIRAMRRIKQRRESLSHNNKILLCEHN